MKPLNVRQGVGVGLLVDVIWVLGALQAGQPLSTVVVGAVLIAIIMLALGWLMARTNRQLRG